MIVGKSVSPTREKEEEKYFTIGAIIFTKKYFLYL